jgi:hypothetical protein
MRTAVTAVGSAKLDREYNEHKKDYRSSVCSQR